tara:strand:+ start:92 stop:1033 length:942 start_codon:yes stop_codon:yes gene_type:complete
MKIGLCGTSNISKTYLKCFKKLGYEIEIVFGSDLKRLSNFAKSHKIKYFTNDLNELISKKEVDCYIIVNDPSKHIDVAEILVKANKHVLIEKPLDISVDKIKKFCELAKNKNKVVHVVNQNRFDPQFIRLKSRIDDHFLKNKDVTKYAYLRMFFYRNNDYFNSSNQWKKNYSCPLINQGIHYLDLMNWFFGNFLDVKSFTQKDNINLKLNDNIIGLVKFENNVLLNIFSSTSIKRNDIKFEFISGGKILKFEKNNSFLRIKNLFSSTKSQFNLFLDQCKLFVDSVKNNDLTHNNVFQAFNAVKLAKKLNNIIE